MTERPKGPPPTSPNAASLAEVEGKLKEIEDLFATKVTETADSAFLKEKGILNQLYTGRLSKLGGDPSTPPSLVATLRLEFERIHNGEEVPLEDGPEIPTQLVELREAYRKKLQELQVERDRVLVQLLVQKSEQFSVLSEEFVSAEKNLSAKHVLKAKADLEKEIEALRESITESDQSVSDPEPVEMPTEPVPEPATAEAMLELLPSPPQTPSETGTLIIVPRDETRREDFEELRATKTAVAVSGDFILRQSGRVDRWFDPPEKLNNAEPFEEVEEWTDVAKFQIARQSKMVGHAAALHTDGTLSVINSGWGEPKAYEEHLEGVENVVDFAINPLGGVALRNDGTLVLWGDFAEPVKAGVREIARVGLSPKVLVGIEENGTLRELDLEGGTTYFGGISKVEAVYLGTQAIFGAVVQLPGGKLQTVGSFQKWQEPLDDKLEGLTTEKVVAGFEGFAVRTAEDATWHFFGEKIDTPTASRETKDCFEVVIERSFISGLED